MNICVLCQQICNNLTKIYSNRFKTLAQIILRLKGFKESQEINSVLTICDNCKQGIESVAKFWEHIPEAKQENLSNNAGNVQEIYETSPNRNYQDEMVTYTTQNLPAIKQDQKDNYQEEDTKKPIKLKIKRKRKDSNSYAVVSSTTAENCSRKRLRQPPKRYDDYDIELPSYPERRTINHVKMNNNRMGSNTSLFHKLPPIAFIRSKSGTTLGHLIEIENKTQTSRMRMICVICSNIFSYEKEFHKHLEIHKTQRPFDGDETIGCNNFLYSCKLCEKSFKEHYAVRRHFKSVHSDERPLKCEHCSANFKYKFNLDYHMAKHVPKKRFECLYCKKSFIMRYELQIHLRTHTKEKPYKCEFCTYAIAHRSNLKAHQKLKHLQNLSPNNSVTVEESTSNEVIYCTENNPDSRENMKQLENNPNSRENMKQLDNVDNIPTHVEMNTNDSSEKEIFSFTDLSCNAESINYLVENSISKESLISDSINNRERSSLLQIEYIPDEKENDDNKMLIRSNSNNSDNIVYDYRKQLTSAASLYSFKIPNTTLRIISQSPLLTMKKWPKSYQPAITETSHTTTIENKSSILECKNSKEKSDKDIELCSKDMELKSTIPATPECKKSNEFEAKIIATDEVSLRTNAKTVMSGFNTGICHNFLNNLNDDNNNNIVSEISNSVEKNTSNESTVMKKASADNIHSDKEFNSFKKSENFDIKSNFVPNDTSTPSKTKEFIKINKLNSSSPAKECRNLTKTEKIINDGKLSKFPPIILDPKHSKNIQIIKVRNKNDSNNNINTNVKYNNPLKVSNASDIKTRVKFSLNDIFKVSPKPVKITNLKKLNNSNTILESSKRFNLPKSLTNSSIKESSISCNDNSYNLALTNSKRNEEIIKNNSMRSILKTEIKKQQTCDNDQSTVKNVPNEPSKTNGLTKNNSMRSLLKPAINSHQTLNSNLNTNSEINNFPDKPLITKVEILPPLTSLPTTLGKSLAFSSTPRTYVQPLKEYKYQCPYCWKYFKQKSPLTKHIRTHTGEKPYKCNLCPKSYADASNFKKHKMLHKNAAEALNISNTTTAYPVQSSPAHSTVSDPDPDGIEVMQTIKKFESSPLLESNDMYDDDDVSLTSSTMESYMWEDALDHAILNNNIQENIKRNLASFTNAIMPNNVQDNSNNNKTSINRILSCEDPD